MKPNAVADASKASALADCGLSTLSEIMITPNEFVKVTAKAMIEINCACRLAPTSLMDGCGLNRKSQKREFVLLLFSGIELVPDIIYSAFPFGLS